jgi:hypothetical protein
MNKIAHDLKQIRGKTKGTPAIWTPLDAASRRIIHVRGATRLVSRSHVIDGCVCSYVRFERMVYPYIATT